MLTLRPTTEITRIFQVHSFAFYNLKLSEYRYMGIQVGLKGNSRNSSMEDVDFTPN